MGREDLGTCSSREKQPGAKLRPPHFSPGRGRELRDESCRMCLPQHRSPILRGKARRAVHSTERALLTLASLPPFRNSSSVIPPAMHSTMSKKRESWGEKGPVRCSQAGRHSHVTPTLPLGAPLPPPLPPKSGSTGANRSHRDAQQQHPWGEGSRPPRRGCHLDGRCPRVQPHVGAGVQRRDDVGGQKLLSGIRGEENHPADLPGHSRAEATATVT